MDEISCYCFLFSLLVVFISLTVLLIMSVYVQDELEELDKTENASTISAE